MLQSVAYASAWTKYTVPNLAPGTARIHHSMISCRSRAAAWAMASVRLGHSAVQRGYAGFTWFVQVASFPRLSQRNFLPGYTRNPRDWKTGDQTHTLR